MGFFRQEYWSGLPFPLPGDLPEPGIKPTSLALQVDSLPLSHCISPYHVLLLLLLSIVLEILRETQVQSLDWEDPLEEEMATHTSILAWRIP